VRASSRYGKIMCLRGAVGLYVSVRFQVFRGFDHSAS
jgi:hypothetical protein